MSNPASDYKETQRKRTWERRGARTIWTWSYWRSAVCHHGTPHDVVNDEALSQTVKFKRNCHLAEPPSDASPGGVVRTHRAIEADSEDAPIRPYNGDICM